MNYNYEFTAKELDNETSYNYFGARYYDSDVSIWLSVDPMSDKYPSMSPYNYCANNPVMLVDPNGMETNPIFDLNGNFLGTDDRGLQGKAIIMKNEDFTQGMSHDEAKSKDLGVKNLNSAKAAKNVYSTMCSLPNRPDWDGFVTREEGISWAKRNPNALENPNSLNSLYIDASQLDFGDLGTHKFNYVGVSEPQNLLTVNNLADAIFNNKLKGTVYALGRVHMKLIHRGDRGDRTVEILNTPATDYDWNTGGGFFRNSLIEIERFNYMLNDNHGFKVYYYGVGKLNW